jgi:hypothetical protein
VSRTTQCILAALIVGDRTSRYFHEICTPFVYFELDIFPKKCVISAASSSLGQYAGYIRNLRIIMAKPPDEDDGEKYGLLIRQALSLCTSATSLTIYYDDLPAFRLRALGLVDAVVSLMSRGRLRSLEVCSIPARASTWWYNHLISVGLVDLIARIIPPLGSSKELTTLEITSESLPSNIYDEIRSKSIFLESLTLRCCLAIALGRLWDQDQISKWAPNQNLTRLNLINCQNGYAPHLPNLVRHFSSLKHLFISACGDFSDVETSPRKTGWSQESNALWKQRPPLDVLHIEHTLEWEIVAIGIIPTKTLVATSLGAGHLFGAFSLDEEIFPGLTVLKLDDIRSNIPTDVESPDYHGQTDWERILTLRGVELKEGAQWLVNVRKMQQV